MINRKTGQGKASGISRLTALCARTSSKPRRGVILLAVLVFVAMLLPLITLVLTSVNTESVATAEAIKGTKAEMAAEKAINDAISLVVQEKAYPSFYTSTAQPTTAIIVNDPATGYRRSEVPDNGADGAAGEDDQLGTGDDYWIGPRLDGSHIGDVDNEVNPRMYRWDFRYPNTHGPTYLGQSWSFSTDYHTYARSPYTSGGNNWIWLLNQYAAVEVDTDSDDVDDGYDTLTPFNGNDAWLHGPGYYTGADEPRDGTGMVVRDMPTSDNDIESYMYNAKVNIYNSIYTDLDRGPIPTSLLKSYADVTDEAGRINLNIFCKKVPVYMPESAETDYDDDGYGTNDFNLNGVFDEEGWKWMDNPLFPDRLTTMKWQFDSISGQFAAAPEPIDFGYMSGPYEFSPPGGSATEMATPELGESAQHYYAGDGPDADLIPESIECCRESLNMLMALPGVTPQLAVEILTYLNPPHDSGDGAYDSDPWWVGGGSYPTLDARLNVANQTLNYDYDSNSALATDSTVGYPDRRVDACNMTPSLMALDVTFVAGRVDDYRWDFGFSQEDDMPLPQPRPLGSLDKLRSLPSMTERQFERLKDSVTIFSYDTNVIANYIQDVGPDADLVNAYVSGDPEYNGAAIIREVTEETRDSDDVADLRYDIARFDFGGTLADYTEQASEMFAYVREHLPRPLKDKVTLPVVDRLGRSGSVDDYIPNTDPRFDLADASNPSVLIPHRDTEAHPWNVGVSGHEYDVTSSGGGTRTGAGYPALNPAFSLDSCLSIVMYRNGAYRQLDDYTFNPDQGAGAEDPWPDAATPGFGDFLSLGPWLVRLIGPWASFLEANNDPYSFTGENVNPVIRAHGSGLMDDDNLINPGAFDSVADVLDVPLYEFGSMSVAMMADPPSDFRFDINGNGTVDTGIMEEGLGTLGNVNANAVNYYISFSDVVDLSWYNTYINPDGPDGRTGTGDEPNLDLPLYYLYFTNGNRPNLQWDPDSTDLTAVIPLTPMQLRAVGGGTEGGSTRITIQAYDNFNNLDMLSARFTDSPYFGSYVQGGHGAAGSGGSRTGGWGSLRRRYGWDDVPERGLTLDSNNNYRPDEAGYWHSGADNDPDYSGPQFNSAAERSAWALDAYGDPYLTARVEVRKMDPESALTEAVPNRRCDENSQLFLQYNDEAEIPFMVNILPVRISGDQFEIRSSYGGAEATGGTYLLYDWEYDGVPDSYDGTWPSQSWQTGDPRVIRITPEDTSGIGTMPVQLHLYDLRAFQDSVGGVPYLPLAPGDMTDPATPGFGPAPAVVIGDEVQQPPMFPSDPLYGATYPPEIVPGYAQDAAIVNAVNYTGGLVAQVAVSEPSVWEDDGSATIYADATGGQLPYTYRMRVLRAAYGGPGGAGAYQGPDNFGDISSWPEGFSPIPRSSRISSGVAYDALNPNSIVTEQTITIDDVSRSFTINPEALGMDSGDPLNAPYGGEYWVELRVTDSTGTAVDHVYSEILVGTDSQPSGSSGIPPSMNASINLNTLGENRKGFICSAAVDGGEGGYNYRWEVRRPVYGVSGSTHVIDGTEIVDSNPPFVSIDANDLGAGTAYSTVMVSNEANPTFEFHTQDVSNNDTGVPGSDGIPDADGVYFIYCYIMDQASSPPSFARCELAQDVVMVTLSDSGVNVGELPSGSRLARTPMAVLHASPPGNSSTAIGSNPLGSGGSDQPYIGSVTASPAVTPDVAANGDVIVIRGFNFAASTNPVDTDYIPGLHLTGRFADNYVTFGGGLTARPLKIVDEGVTLEIPAGSGLAYRQMAMHVRVPSGAQTGYLTVTTPQGTSQRVFFQTAFNVTFDLIGKMSPNDPTYLQFDLDYQGDGFIDYTFNSTANPDGEGQIRGSDHGITHDYAADGFGNYNATLYVTDLVSGRRATGHQLVTINDLNPNSRRALLVAAGSMTSLTGDVMRDDDAAFVISGVSAGDEVLNVTTGETAFVQSRLNAQELQIGPISGGPGIWSFGDLYEIRRWMTVEDDQGANAMLATIWPEIESRYETFTDDPQYGVMFHSAIGGASNVQRKWQVDLNGSPGGGIGGELVIAGTSWVTDLSGVTIVDNNANFLTAGRFGVREDDLVILTETDSNGSPPPPNSTSNADEVVSTTVLNLQHPADPTLTVGFDNGSTITRLGTVTNVPGGFNPGVSYVIEDNNYDWVGDGASLVPLNPMGGILADNNPNTPNVGDTIYNLGNNTSQWLVIDDYLSDPTLSSDQVRVGYTGPPVGQQGAVVTAVNVAPAGVDAAISINIATNPAWANPPGTILHNDTNNGTWRIIGVPGANDLELRQLGGSGIIAVGDALRANPVGGFGPPPPAWTTGDSWRIDIPADQIRIGMDYAIYTDNGFETSAWADACYATPLAPIDFTISMTYPFDLSDSQTGATLVYIDWDNDGVIDSDDTYAVGDTTRLDGATNGMEVESLTVTHAFNVPALSGTDARYYVEAFPRGVAMSSFYPSLPVAGGGYQLPQVIIGGDDYGASDLTSLRVANWDRDSWHRVMMESSFSTLTSLLEGGWVSGTTNTVNRTYFANDQMLVPPGIADYEDTGITWVSYSNPFISTNFSGVTNMRHQAIHGISGSLNWLSDCNADTRWSAGANESPQGNNPVNYHEFLFQNGPNNMPVPGVASGASFPQAVTGIGRSEVSGAFIHYQSDRGVYTGMGFVSDDLAPLDRTFSFDTQTLFLGDRVQSNTTSRLALAADFEVEPIVGTNFQNVQLRSYATGGGLANTSYDYYWFVEKISGSWVGNVGLDGAYGIPSGSTIPCSSIGINPVFDPYGDVTDEPGAGTDNGEGIYRVWLQVDDGSGGDPVYTTCVREFEVVAMEPSIHVMADPPSGTVGSEIQYYVYVEGGVPSYTVDFDFDNDGTVDATRDLSSGGITVVSNVYSDPGVYNCRVEAYDSDSTDANPALFDDWDVTTVEIADEIPLNANLMVNPPSGVAPFLVDVHYSVFGGDPLSGDTYNVSVQLVSVNGDAENTVSRSEPNTFGLNGIIDDPRLPTSDDDPVQLVVPAAGNYYVYLTVTDNTGRVKTRMEDVYASGYLLTNQYGETSPQVVRDMEGRPMHAVRIWVDPYMHIGDGTTGTYENLLNYNEFSGGRLMEGDLQVIGDIFTTDPNPSMRSSGMQATADPLSQPAYYANYTLDAQGNEQVQDFYDTFTMGRININTASEDVLAALFRKIRRSRDYLWNEDIDLYGTGDETYRVVRNEEADTYLTEQQARQLARKVIRYRTAYYDLHKPTPPDANDQFGYEAAAGVLGLGGDFRVDHLPVIGPFDGTNPHEYGINDRNADLQDPDNSGDDVNNAWDHMAATYYNFDETNPDDMFYAPSDIAIVRDRWHLSVGISIPGFSTTLDYDEPASNYAKYLNDVAHNQAWDDNRSGEMTDWTGTGQYQVGSDNYSSWAFDARNYFTYAGAELNATVQVTNIGDPPVVTIGAIGGGGTPEDARNNVAIIDSNGVTAYTYMPNPPFRHLFDLYKVIDNAQGEDTFDLDSNSGDGYIDLEAAGDDEEFFSTSAQVFSGPSVFRYVSRWDDQRCEFVPLANYLDDIAPYVTCRSYVFRVEASGAVTASGGANGALVDTAKISRDRSKMAVVDVGPLWARRDVPVLSDIYQGAGWTSPDRNLSYRILWYTDNTE